ncbi:hypothetical protein [Micromonospora chersina]|uniref:hypothetical protein n=1 Tax=Micromonospora chersina TaxID=47854 RepID=UPI003716BAD4
MASIEKRTWQDGKTTRWRVRWRVAASASGAGCSSDRNGDAKRFKALVEANGHLMPPPAQLVEPGFGYLVPGGVAAPASTSPR